MCTKLANRQKRKGNNGRGTMTSTQYGLEQYHYTGMFPVGDTGGRYYDALRLTKAGLSDWRIQQMHALVRKSSFSKAQGLHNTGHSCRTLIDVCVCVCVCVSLSADISLNCAKNDSTDYPEILWVCWV